ncbi:hypothetical protein Spith_1494 [Spirochaeta thermophila DSM 6578]|uniref:Putative auto-transporter adhesin head GIN domain-containing protein n=1 Tax=Winmispira thermophila (strain ATCC 700085 / DSM 6578 / Z-1203) TaxID=869211 RepID=G0GAD8_WINT7|nr:DUF2807 domain-containing protein [Spirochaeta thermophila]AEJ61757.1 hypothetical protein Spith_1494 [Spirochaeta thermophila DSM 6578]
MRRKVTNILLEVWIGVMVLLVGLFPGIASCVGEPHPLSWGDVETRKVEGRGFSKIVSSGVWEIRVVKGDEWSVEVEAPERLFEYLEVKERGDILSLGWRGRVTMWGNVPTPVARITVPSLRSVELSGACELTFRGLVEDRFSLEVSGAADVVGKEAAFGELELEVSGAGRVDLYEVEVEEAEVEISGAAHVTLWVTERLLGSVSGVGSLRYRGNPSEVDVDVSGAGSVAPF